MAISAGDVILTFNGDATELNKTFDQVKEKSKAAIQPAANDMAALQSRMEQVENRSTSLSEKLGKQSSAHKQVSKDVNESRGALALMGEEIGVTIPRHLQTFLAVIPGVGEALSLAFAPAAVFALVEVIGKLVEMEEAHKEALLKSRIETENQTIAEKDRTQNLELTNLKLQDAIDKFEGRPSTNKLAEALLAAKIQADGLAAALATDLQKSEELIEKQSGIWETLKSNAENAILGFAQGGAAVAAGEIANNQLINKSLDEVSAKLREVDAAQLKLSQSSTQDQQRAAIVGLQNAYNSLGATATNAFQVVSALAPRNVQLIQSLQTDIIKAGAGVQDMTLQFKNLGLAIKAAQQETGGEQAALSAEKAKQSLDAQVAAIDNWKAAQHAAFASGAIDAATWAAAQLRATDEASVAQEQYQSRLVEIYTKSGETLKAQTAAQQLATLEIANQAKATEALAAAEQKYHEVSAKTIADWLSLTQAAVGKAFDDATQATQRLTKAQQELGESQKNLKLSEISADFSQQEQAIKQLADFGVISEQQKAEKLAVLYQAENKQALDSLAERLHQEQTIINTAVSDLQQAKQNPFLTDGQIIDLQAKLDRAQAAFDKTQAEINKTTTEGAQKIAASQTQAALAVNSLSGAFDNWSRHLRADFQLANTGLTGFQRVFDGVVTDLSQTFGNAVSAWVLGQESLGQALKQSAAQYLAALAGKAAVDALYFLAWGIADTFWNPARAGADFAAAAEFAAVAGAAGVTAAALSGGNKQNTSGAPSGPTATPPTPAESPGQQPVQTTNIQRLAGGGVVTGPTTAIIGDSPSGGRQVEAVLPLEDNSALKMIANAIAPMLIPHIDMRPAVPPVQTPAQPARPLTARLASGGIVTEPTVAIVGDAPGGEIVIPLHDSAAQRMFAEAINAALLPTIQSRTPASPLTELLSPRTLASVTAIDAPRPNRSDVSSDAGETHNHYVTNHAWDVHIDGAIDSTNLGKVMKEMTKQVSKGQGRLKSNTSFRVTRRG